MKQVVSQFAPAVCPKFENVSMILYAISLQ